MLLVLMTNFKILTVGRDKSMVTSPEQRVGLKKFFVRLCLVVMSLSLPRK